MFKRFSIKLDKERYEYIEKYRIENNLEDNSEALRLIISDSKKFSNLSFLKKFKYLFLK